MRRLTLFAVRMKGSGGIYFSVDAITWNIDTMSQDDRLGELEAFAHVARNRSLTIASERLDVAVSSISRRLAKLEKRLSTRLVERSTRNVRLTEAGLAFLPECERALEAYLRATERPGGDDKLQGCIRLSVPSSFGRSQILPLLPAFRAHHPGVSFDIAFSDQFMDLGKDGFDLGIRIGASASRSDTVWPLGINRRLVCASPAYLKRFGVPTRPAQLAQHPCLGFASLLLGDTWTFTRGSTTEVVAVQGPYRANDADAIRELALAGEGIAMQAEFNASDDIAAGRLVRILSGWRLPTTAIVAQLASSRYVPARVEAFIAFLRASFPRYLR